jgi:hypothetical protein
MRAPSTGVEFCDIDQNMDSAGAAYKLENVTRERLAPATG